MRTTNSYIRFFIFLGISFGILAYAIAPEQPLVVISNGLFWSVFIVVAIIGLAAEVCVTALKSVLYNSLKEDQKKIYLENKAYKKEHRYDKLRAIYIKLLASKPIEEEHEIILEHNYDGIKELDNDLPPWWVYGFYASIIFAAVYLIRFEVFSDYNQVEE